MTDFLAALGLVFAIEGLLFASIPNLAKEGGGRAAAPPPDRMRLIGIVSAIVGVGMVWMVRG